MSKLYIEYQIIFSVCNEIILFFERCPSILSYHFGKSRLTSCFALIKLLSLINNQLAWITAKNRRIETYYEINFLG